MRSKKTAFDPELSGIAEKAHALAHPARIAILRTLARETTCICGDIVEVMPLSQSTVSQHLKVLKEVGFIRGEVDGPHSCYCVNYEVLGKFRDQIDALLEQLSQGRLTEKCCKTKVQPKKASSNQHHSSKKRKTP
jgi:ArsR family transcriptional regulator, arsenate/arsenite/antimonite-responsive transcriptional repressor